MSEMMKFRRMPMSSVPENHPTQAPAASRVSRRQVLDAEVKTASGQRIPAGPGIRPRTLRGAVTHLNNESLREFLALSSTAQGMTCLDTRTSLIVMSSTETIIMIPKRRADYC